MNWVIHPTSDDILNPEDRVLSLFIYFSIFQNLKVQVMIYLKARLITFLSKLLFYKNVNIVELWYLDHWYLKYLVKIGYVSDLYIPSTYF